MLTLLCRVCAFMCRYTVDKALSFCYKRVKYNKHKRHYVALIRTAFEHPLFDHINKTFKRINYLSFLCVVIFLLFQNLQQLYLSQMPKATSQKSEEIWEQERATQCWNNHRQKRDISQPCFHVHEHTVCDSVLTGVLCRERDGFRAGLCSPRKQQPVWGRWGSAACREITEGRALRQEGEGEEAEKGLKRGHSFREYQ